MHAVLDSKGLHQSNLLLMALSVLHLGVSALAISYAGAVGLVAADAFNMLLRVALSLWCVSTST